MRVAFEDTVKCGGGEGGVDQHRETGRPFEYQISVWINGTLSKNPQLRAFYFEVHKMMIQEDDW